MLEPIRRTRLFEVVIERILGLIKGGELKPGDHLPTERELAVQLDVSRTSVREALRALETLGYVESRVGVSGGTFVKTAAPEESLDPAARLLESCRKKEYYFQVIEFRIIFESATAKLAARRRDDGNLRRLDEALESMRSEIDGGGVGLEGERKFHTAVAEATHNEILLKFSGFLEDILADGRRPTLDLPGIPQESLDDHARIYEAIAKRSEKDAVLLMKAHLKKGYDKANKGQLDFDL